jgi:hypothetical protein
MFLAQKSPLPPLIPIAIGRGIRSQKILDLYSWIRYLLTSSKIRYAVIGYSVIEYSNFDVLGSKIPLSPFDPDSYREGFRSQSILDLYSWIRYLFTSSKIRYDVIGYSVIEYQTLMFNVRYSIYDKFNLPLPS